MTKLNHHFVYLITSNLATLRGSGLLTVHGVCRVFEFKVLHNASDYVHTRLPTNMANILEICL